MAISIERIHPRFGRASPASICGGSTTRRSTPSSTPSTSIRSSSSRGTRGATLIDPEDRRMIYHSANQMWHTDSSFKRVPALASLLSGRECSKNLLRPEDEAQVPPVEHPCHCAPARRAGTLRKTCPAALLD
jgi:hypothetical protein